MDKGTKVKVEYTGSFDDGTVFDSSAGREPLEFEIGAGQVIVGFERAVASMKVGEERKVVLAPKDAYGDPNPELLKKVPKNQVPEGIEAGMQLEMPIGDGRYWPVRVAAVDDKHVTIDLNHPLAGKTLHFQLKVVDVVKQ